MKLNQSRRSLLLGVVALSLLAPWLICVRVFARDPQDLSQDARLAIRNLEQQVTIDRHTNLLDTSMCSHALPRAAVLAGSESEPVQERSLEILAEVIRQCNLSKTVLADLEVQAEKLQSYSGDSRNASDQTLARIRPGTSSPGRLIERVLWQIKVHQKVNRTEQLAFLSEYIDDEGDDNYYSKQALDYISDLDSDDAKVILEEQLKTSSARSSPRDLIRRIQIALLKVDRLRSLRGLDEKGTLEVWNAFVDENAARDQKPELAIWAIRHLERIGSKDAGNVLREIWKHASYDIDCRYAAQEALVRLGQISATERSIVWQ